MASIAPESPRLAPALQSLLASLRQRIRAYVWAHGLCAALACVGVCFWISLAIDYFQEPPAAIRIALLVAAGLALLYVIGRLIVRRSLAPLADRSMALLLERRFGEFRDSLLTAVELTGPEQQRDDFNKEMLLHACKQAEQSGGAVQLGRVFNPRPLVLSALAGIGLTLSIAGFAYGAPDAFRLWYRRSFELSSELWPRQTRLLPIEGFVDGKVRIARGSDLQLVVKADTQKVVPQTVQIRYRTEEGARGRENMIKDGVADPARDPFQAFNYSFQGVLTPIRFDVIGGDDRLSDLLIEVVDSPTITSMTLACEYPAYMVRPELQLYTPRELPVSEFMQLPLGTKVTVKCQTNKPLVAAQVAFPLNKNPASLRKLDFASSAARREFEIPLEPLTEDVTLLFTLSDVDGIKNQEPIRLSLGARPDDAPQVGVRFRGIGTAITPQARLPIVGEILDDYGLAATWFEHVVDENEPVRRQFAKSPDGVTELKFGPESVEAFDARDELKLEPKQKLQIAVRASDKCDLEGPEHAGSSQKFLLDVVTLDQLRLLLEARELNLRRRFETIIQEATDSRDLLSTVKIEAAATKLPSGDTQSPEGESVQSVSSLQVQRAVQNCRKHAYETLSVAAGFDEIREELVNNRLDTEELKARLNDRIAVPLRKIGDERFAEMEKRLELLLSKVGDEKSGPPALDASKQQLDLILVEMQQVLSEMLELETFNEAVALLRSIIESQEKVNEATKKKRKALLEE